MLSNNIHQFNDEIYTFLKQNKKGDSSARMNAAATSPLFGVQRGRRRDVRLSRTGMWWDLNLFNLTLSKKEHEGSFFVQ